MSLKLRPDTLYEAVRRHSQEGESYFTALREFYDHLYRSPFEERANMFREEPLLLENERYNAYAAAVAEHFALRYKFRIPNWALDKKKRFLLSPWFPCEIQNLKAILIAEFPIAFRRRFIFVDADPCFRPSRNIYEPQCSPWGTNE